MMMKYLSWIAALLWIPLQAVAEAEVDQITERVIELLQKELDQQEATSMEEGILLLVPTVKFEPLPLAFHRQYVDQIVDFHEGRVMRTYYDYLGTVTRRKERRIDQETLTNYVASLVKLHVEAKPGTVLPEFVRVILSESGRTGKPDSDGNAEKPPGDERTQ